MKAVEDLLFQSPHVQIVKFRVPTHSEFWGFEHPDLCGPAIYFCMAPFRRSWVTRGIELVCTPHDVCFTNSAEVVALEPVGSGDALGSAFSFDLSVVLDVVGEYDPTVVHTAEPFSHSHAPADPYVYRIHHELVSSLDGAIEPDPVRTEETVLELLSRVVAAAYRLRCIRPKRARWPVRKRHWAAVQDAVELMSLRHAEKLLLSEIAAVTELSMPYFCRVFKRLTGSTVHGYLTQLRLRFALARLLDAGDLTQLSLAHGFCDMAHFSVAFRREFGVPPTLARDSLLKTRPRAVSDIVGSCMGQ